MKTTLEIPDDLFRQVKAKAALEGLRLRDLVEYGLRLAIETPFKPADGQRTSFPLIRATGNAPVLTDEQVSAALANLDDEDVAHHAGFVRR